MSILRYKNSSGQWTELPLLEGPPGMSAYEHAVAGGYDGTLEEFEEQLNAVVNIDEVEELGIDSNPTENSNNLITSGGVYSALNGKVDKVSGKGLSTNDYDTTAKAKVDAIPSTPKYTDTIYDDTAIKSRVSTIENKEAGWDAKQDAIPDLATIRSGAALGTTALQSVPSTYALKTDLPTKTSDLVNDSGFFGNGDTQEADFVTLANVAISGSYNDLSDQPTIPSIDGLATEQYVVGYAEERQFTSIYQVQSLIENGVKKKQDTISDLSTIRSGAALGATAVQPEAGKGLFSGNYNDLTNKPTIPSAVTEATVSGWGFTKNTGTYSKPSDGIPKTDLASAVQTSLGKADTALQEHQDISGKQDVISDLSTIRSNASAGASKISCTDAQVSSYGYIKLSDLPIYNGGVS